MNIDFSQGSYKSTIIADKHTPCPDDLVRVSIGNTFEAMSELSPYAFMLYMYFVLTNDRSPRQFSSGAFCEMTGAAEETYVDAHNELVASAYLSPICMGTDILCFRDSPALLPHMRHNGSSDEDIW